MPKIKKVINGLIAFLVANTPSLFPNEHIILGIYILGLCTILCGVYILLNKLTIKD